MVYDLKSKQLDDVEFTNIEYQIFELLLKYNGEPLTLEKMHKLLNKKYYIKSFRGIKAHICRMNKKLNKLIKCKYYAGYYISEEIKFK